MILYQNFIEEIFRVMCHPCHNNSLNNLRPLLSSCARISRQIIFLYKFIRGRLFENEALEKSDI